MKKLQALIKQVLGYLLYRYFRLFRKTTFAVITITNLAFNRASSGVPKTKIFYLTVGFSGSGKTTLVTNHGFLKQLFCIDTGYIHNHLNEMLLYLQVKDEVHSVVYWVRQFLTREIKLRLLHEALVDGFCIIDDSCNLSRGVRNEKIERAIKQGYRTRIIHVSCPEDVLLKRLAERDTELTALGKDPVWCKLYFKEQKPNYDSPTPDEVGEIIMYNSNIQKPSDLSLS